MPVTATDTFATFTPSLDSPLSVYLEITPSDSDELAVVSRAILLGAAGTLKVTRNDGTTVSFASGELTAGVWHPLRVRKVWSTGTGATPIKVGY